MIHVNDQLIEHLEDLSNISLSKEDKAQLKDRMQNIIEMMSKLNELDTENVAERSHPLDQVNVFRDDLVIPSFDRNLILQNAKEHNGKMFIAPRTVGD